VQALFELAGELTLVAIFLLCYLTMQGYRFSFRPVLLGIAWVLQHFAVSLPLIGSVGPGPWLARQFHRLDNIILENLSAGITATEQWIVALWNGSAALMEFVALEIEGLAKDTAVAVEHLGGSAYGKLRRLVEGLIAAALVAGRKALVELIKRLTGVLHALVQSIMHRLTAIAAELTHPVGYTKKNLRALLRRLSKLWWLTGVAGAAALGLLILKRLNLKWLYGYKTLAALGLAILVKLGLRDLTCDNNKAVNKNTCGMDSNLLQELLLDTLGILGAVSLIEFARDLQDITDESVTIMRGFIREF